MHCKLLALKAKICTNVDKTFVYCNSQGCRFHVNDGTFTQCSNPYVIQKHSDKHSLSTVRFVEGCLFCNGCNDENCPFSCKCVDKSITTVSYGTGFESGISVAMLILALLEIVNKFIHLY